MVWLSGKHILGCENTTADIMSRSFNQNTEWILSNSIFQGIMQYFLFALDVSLVETYENKQVAKYVPWYPEPASYAVDALKLDWQASTIYPNQAVIFKTHLKKSFVYYDYSILANTKLVLTYEPVSNRLPIGNPNHHTVHDSSSRPK